MGASWHENGRTYSRGTVLEYERMVLGEYSQVFKGGGGETKGTPL